MAYRPFIGVFVIHGISANLLCDYRIEVLFKSSDEIDIVAFMRYRCGRAMNEVGALSGYNIEEVLQLALLSGNGL